MTCLLQVLLVIQGLLLTAAVIVVVGTGVDLMLCRRSAASVLPTAKSSRKRKHRNSLK